MSNPERRLIGCIMLAADEIVPTLRGVLQPDHFADSNYRALWMVACKLMDEGWSVDYRTTSDRLSKNQDIADLAKAVHGEAAHSHNWRYYAWELIERRERALLGMDVTGDFVELLEKRIEKLKRSQVRLRTAQNVLKRAVRV